MLNFHSLYSDCVWYKKLRELASVHYIAIRNNEVWVYYEKKTPVSDSNTSDLKRTFSFPLLSMTVGQRLYLYQDDEIFLIKL